MSDTIDILKKLALQIRNASTEGENTAERIGNLFVGIVDNMSDAGSGSIDISSKLDKSVWDAVFYTDEYGNLRVKTNLLGEMGISGYRAGEGTNLPSIYDGMPIDNITLYWDNGVLKSKGGDGMNEGKLKTYLDTNAYINNGNKANYLPSWALATNKPAYTWSEISNKPTTLDGYGITDVVTLNTAQAITGAKDFTGGFSVNGGAIAYDTATKGWKLAGNLLVIGGITAYGDILTGSAILDALPVDSTLSKEGGVLSVVGGHFLSSITVKLGTVAYDSVSGIVSLPAYPTTLLPASDVSAWAKASNKPAYTWSEINNKPAWIGSDKPVYAWTEIGSKPSWIGANKPSYVWSEIGGKPSWIGDNKPSYAFSEIGGKPTTLSGYGITDAVTLNTSQTITAAKNFTGGFAVNGCAIVYDAVNKAWKLTGNLLVTGGITAYGDILTGSAILDALPVDSTLSKEGGVLSVVGGGFLSSITVKLGAVSYDSANGIVSLPSYPTTLPASDVSAWAKSASKPAYTWGEIGGKPSTFAPSAHTHAISEITSLQGLLDGKAASSHTHNYAGTVKVGATGYNVTGNVISLPEYPTALKSPNALTISLNGASQGAYDGSAAKSFNINYSNVGAPSTTGANASGIWNINIEGSSVLTSRLRVQDIRGTNATPNDSIGANNCLAAWFNQTGTPSSDWWSGLTVKGWSNDYVVWQLAGISTASVNNRNLHVRFGVGTTWQSWRALAFLDDNVASATKLQTARSINGTNFDGTGNIVTSYWGTARNFSIVSSNGSGASSTVSVNGSGSVSLYLPSTITASLSGNATTATTLQTARTIFGQSFNGSNNVSGAFSGATTGIFSSTLTTYGITQNYSGTSWIDMFRRSDIIQGNQSQSTSSAHALFRVSSNADHRVVFGGLNNDVGFYGLYKSTLNAGTNQTDWRTTWNTANGYLSHSAGMGIGGLLELAGNIKFTTGGYHALYNSSTQQMFAIDNNGVYVGGIAGVNIAQLEAGTCKLYADRINDKIGITSRIESTQNNTYAFDWAKFFKPAWSMIGNVNNVVVQHNSLRSILSWRDTVYNNGWATSYSIGCYRENNKWGTMILAVSNNDAGTSRGAEIGIKGDGTVYIEGNLLVTGAITQYSNGISSTDTFTSNVLRANNCLLVGSSAVQDASERMICCYKNASIMYINLGNNPSAANTAELSFNYVGNGSGNNYIGLGFYGGTKYGMLQLYASGANFLHGSLTASGSITQGSDMRRKTVVRSITGLTTDQIANTPLFDYYWKDLNDGAHTGTSAQYWQNILPNTVRDNGINGLALDYNGVNIAGLITVSREIVKLKRENEELRQEINKLKERAA